jgi:ribosomal protein S27E
MSTSDYKVSPLYAHEIADIAASWRRQWATTASANRLDICRFLTEVVLPSLAAMGRSVQLELADPDEREKAWVDLGQKKLFVREDVWQMALMDDPRARLVIAHEIGHLALHSAQVSAFTKGYDYKLNYLEPIESAETQANWFAWALLLPDNVLLRLRATASAAAISILAMVEVRLVEKRLEQLQLDKRYRSNFTGDACPRCENFTVAQTGITSTCTTCGLGIASA